MKITKNRLPKRQLAILTTVGILVVGALGYWVYDQNAMSNEELTEAADKTSTVQQDQAGSDSPNENPSADLPQKPPYQDDEPTNGGSGDDATGVTPEKPEIFRAYGGKVVAIFQKASSGTCELKLSHGTQVVTRTASVVTGSEYYACSFNIKDLPNVAWKLIVTHHIGNASTASATETYQVD